MRRSRHGMGYLGEVIPILLGLTTLDLPVFRTNTHNFADLQVSEFARYESEGTMIYTADVRAARPFRDAVPSWIARTPGGSKFEVLLSPLPAADRAYSLGVWSQDGSRTSINEQVGTSAEVLTDILRTKEPATGLRVTILATPGTSGMLPEIDRVRLSLTDVPAVPQEPAPSLATPLPALAVPMRAQATYPGGNVLCSPTSVSMILAYWAQQTQTPSIDADVPEVQKGVHDPAWGGTGNWAFNTAYAATRPGMTGFVTRLRDMSDLELWVSHGIPVATSVSYALLKGKPKQESNDGHLVVVVGFEPDGTPIFNDPGRNIVRLTYQREDLKRAWGSSGNTVYIIHPVGHRTPKEVGPWPAPSEM